MDGEIKKPLISQGLMGVVALCWIVFWWRRRESNPGPEIFHEDLYIHIS